MKIIVMKIIKETKNHKCQVLWINHLIIVWMSQKRGKNLKI